MRGFRQFRAWDAMVFLVLSPLVLIMAANLPADIAMSRGRALPGTATVVLVEQRHGQRVPLVDVRSMSGVLVAARSEVNGDMPSRVGAQSSVRYVQSSVGRTQVYARGADSLG